MHDAVVEARFCSSQFWQNYLARVEGQNLPLVELRTLRNIPAAAAAVTLNAAQLTFLSRTNSRIQVSTNALYADSEAFGVLEFVRGHGKTVGQALA